MRQINLSRDAAKFLGKLENKFVKQLALRIKSLAVQDHAHDSKALKGKLANYHRIDVGEFRIIYKYAEQQLYIVLVGKRNDNEVYKLMNRKVDNKTLQE